MPSEHTDIALITLGLAFWYTRKLFYLYLPMVLGLIFITVYLRYYYVVDVLAGMVLAAIYIVRAMAFSMVGRTKTGSGKCLKVSVKSGSCYVPNMSHL